MAEAETKKTLSRRQFIGIAWLGAGVVILGEAFVALFNYLKPVSAVGFGGMVYAGKVDEFPVNSVNHIMAGRFYLVRLEDGFLALWQRCTHLGCSVPWSEAENHFHCPCHGSLFNIVGEVTGGPAPRPLDTFPVIIKNGEVWVDTSQPTQRTEFDPAQLAGA